MVWVVCWKSIFIICHMKKGQDGIEPVSGHDFSNPRHLDDIMTSSPDMMAILQNQ